MSRNNKVLPTRVFLDECFGYSDGKLIWKKRPREHFKTERGWRCFNTTWAGRRAGKAGPLHRDVRICGEAYLEHRLIAAIFGICLDGEIDHIDGNGLNNKVENLRSASHLQNMRNRRLKHGGVLRMKVRRGGKIYKYWAARGRINGKQIHLGTSKNKGEAMAMRLAFEREHYGEFAPSKCRRAA